jgi:hypothetical protein
VQYGFMQLMEKIKAQTEERLAAARHDGR